MYQPVEPTMKRPWLCSGRIEAEASLRPATARRRRHVLRLAPAIALLAMPSLAVQDARSVPPPPWPAELGAAFELYYGGAFLEVQRVCWQLGAATDDANLRREAAALAAMATMRLPGREDRLTGRAQLAQLAQEDDSLLQRPECQLAYGIAQTALNETASALYHLNQAAKIFADRGQSDRLAETCVELAEAWARHGEWELAVPGMEIPRPGSRAEADRIRVEHIRALRARVVALGGFQDQVDRIDLILAQHLLETEGGTAEGLALLEKLAGGERIAKATAQACLALAEHYETAARWAEASRLYARVQAAGLGTLSRQAEQRRNAILQPQLVLEMPGQVAVGQPVPVSLHARNLAAVEFEVRRVDLAAWLEQRQGRFAEAALPISGALVAARDLDTAGPTEHAWWRSESLDEPLTFDAPLGAVVALARAVDADGRTVTAKRLVLAGDLQATVFIGKQRAAIWATRGQQLASAADIPKLQAGFWMHGSFVPTRPGFEEGVATFALPPEARVLRDRRWVCLVQAGEEVALCHGTLPPGAAALQHRPAVALMGGPPELRVGQRLNVFGMLLGGVDRPLPHQPPQTVELELLDSFDRAHGTAAAAVSETGTFSAHLPVSEAMGGGHLRVIVRLDGEVLENVFSPLRAWVAPVDAAPFRLDCDLPPWASPARKSISGQIKATYPWGTPIAGSSVRARFRAWGLPTAQPVAAQSHPLSRDLRLDEEGKCDFVIPLADFNLPLTDILPVKGLPEGPLAVAAWVDAAGWDGRYAHGSAETLVCPEQVYLRLRCETLAPRAGEPLYVSVEWFDPVGLAAGVRPALAARRDGQPPTQLELTPATHGLVSRAWRPPAPGIYELIATLPLDEGRVVTALDTIRVAGEPVASPPDLAPPAFDARFIWHEGRPHVRVSLDGEQRHPVLVLAESGDPLAARQLPSLDGATELLLPLPGQSQGLTRVLLATPGSEGIQVLGVTDIACASDRALTLSLSVDPADVAPNATVEIVASCRRAGRPARGTTLTARLVDVTRAGELQSLSGETHPKPPLLPTGIEVVSSGQPSATAAASGAVRNVIPETRELPAALTRALFEGATLWVETRPSSDGAATFAVPLPAKPGRYRLIVMAQTPDGACATETQDLDTRGGVQLAAHMPDHLTVGDRSVATLVITNAEPTAAQARVTFDAGAGLQVEQVRRADQQAGVEPSAFDTSPRTARDQTPSDAAGANARARRDAASQESGDRTSLSVTLPPSATITLRASVEAARPGTGTAVLTADIQGTRRSAQASYTVHADVTDGAGSPAPSDKTIVVTRRLFRLEADSVAGHVTLGEDENAHRERPEGQRVDVEPGARISPGQLLLVQEEFTLEQPLTQVEWTQRVPGNCHTHAGEWSDLRRIGTRRELQLQTFTHTAAWLAAGRQHVREYVIVPVRAGACRFPPPEVRADGVPVRVQVEQAVERVLVTGSP
jgi:hypothetical protein